MCACRCLLVVVVLLCVLCCVIGCFVVCLFMSCFCVLCLLGLLLFGYDVCDFNSVVVCWVCVCCWCCVCVGRFVVLSFCCVVVVFM